MKMWEDGLLEQFIQETVKMDGKQTEMLEGFGNHKDKQSLMSVYVMLTLHHTLNIQ